MVIFCSVWGEAYITGIRLYNQLGLTIQLPSGLQIAGRSYRNLSGISFTKVNSVKSYADASEDNYQMLGLPDAMKDLKKSLIRICGRR